MSGICYRCGQDFDSCRTCSRKRKTNISIRRSVAQGCLANIERALRQLRDLPPWGNEIMRAETTIAVADDLELIARALRHSLGMKVDDEQTVESKAR